MTTTPPTISGTATTTAEDEGATPARPAGVERRVARLTAAAARRVIEPDVDVAGRVGDGQILPDELLSVAGLDLCLTPEQRRVLSREEVASVTDSGIRFEAVLEAGFAAHLAGAADVADPRHTFVLHEVGEETRHQRLFQRLYSQLAPTAPRGARVRALQAGYVAAIHACVHLPALFYTLVLGGEEIPDLIQKYASEHPGTDPFVRAVNKYHRQEEARHLSFARAVYPEVWERAGLIDRLAVQYVAPPVIKTMFEMLVQPGVYAAIGLPAGETWRAVNASPVRRQLRRLATRPVLDALIDAGAVRRGAVPRPWRALCGVDEAAAPRPDLSDHWSRLAG